ncbi:MAG TPA: O-antigen ligase family protein [Anaerolineales bacterium]|nr:O-antigen ligase family protein [Anaerolineales bacterium]
MIFFVFALVNTNAFVRFRQFPEVDNYSDNEDSFVFAAVFTLLLILLLSWRNHLFPAYVAAWKKNKILLAFLVYACASLWWTIYLPATQYKLIFLFFSTLAGSYLAVRYGKHGGIRILTWVGASLTVLSVLVVAYFPFVGMMHNQYFLGSWIGVFWHRNHTGNIFAFLNMVFLMRLLFDEQSTRRKRVIFGLLYLISAMIVVGSRSATGLIVFLFLHFVVGLVFAWLKLNEQIKPWHYYGSAGALLAGFLVFITNTAFFFGLLGRTANMTGRVPVWQDLFQSFYLQKPWFGYGYGALWMQKAFRIQMQIRHHWGNQVYFADNGFFDILLNLGLIGFLLFLAVYISMGIRSFKQAIQTKSWLAFFPFMTFLYILIGNLTYSFLLEVDQLVWMLLVMMVFLTTAPNNDSIPQP